MRSASLRRTLIWLPWHQGSPPFYEQARVELGCLLRRLQRGQTINIPYTRPIRHIGPDVYESRVHDRPCSWAVTYRLEPRSVVIVEVLPHRPEFKVYYSAVCRRLLDYDARQPHFEDSAWLQGDYVDFLELRPNEAALVDIRARLAARFEYLRSRDGRTQAEAALQLGSSQSRVAKMEVPESSVSLDLLVRSILALGDSPAELGRLIAGASD